MSKSLNRLLSVSSVSKSIGIVVATRIPTIFTFYLIVFLLSGGTFSFGVVAQKLRSRPSDPQTHFQGSSASVSSTDSSSRCKGSGAGKVATITEAGSSGRIACPGGDCDFQPTPGWYLNLKFFESLTVTDADGHTDKFKNGSRLLQTIPFVTYSNPCPDADCLFAIMPTTKTYTFTFTSRAGEPILIDLVKGFGNTCPDEAVRYLDLLLPKGSAAQLKITLQGVENLRYDHDGDGNFRTMVKPTSRVVAPAAWDTVGPRVRFSPETQDATTILVTITAEDESGVKSLFYSLDGGPVLHYGKPIKATRARTTVIYAFADDKVGNRSGLYTYQTKP